MQYTIEYDGKHLQMRREMKHGWEFVARKIYGQVVGVMALTNNNELILIEQFRPPVDKKVIESPAGLCDIKDEPEMTAAMRELEEETGYVSDEWSVLYKNAPHSCGLTNETSSKFLALNCVKKGSGGGVEVEDIKVHLVPYNDVPFFLIQKQIDGYLVDPKIVSGLYWYEFFQKEEQEE